VDNCLRHRVCSRVLILTDIPNSATDVAAELGSDQKQIDIVVSPIPVLSAPICDLIIAGLPAAAGSTTTEAPAATKTAAKTTATAAKSASAPATAGATPATAPAAGIK
jgi:hypothetical protein